jgi:uncharacterized membrane protein
LIGHVYSACGINGKKQDTKEESAKYTIFMLHTLLLSVNSRIFYYAVLKNGKLPGQGENPSLQKTALILHGCSVWQEYRIIRTFIPGRKRENT